MARNINVIQCMIRHMTKLRLVKLGDFASSFTFCVDQTKMGINIDSFTSK